MIHIIIGEAAYGSIGTPIISDYYPVSERNVAYGIYFLAIPVGAALGYGIGAILGTAFGWRVAFYIIGIPGLFMGFLILRINDPMTGINDKILDNNNNNEIIIGIETNELKNIENFDDSEIQFSTFSNVEVTVHTEPHKRTKSQIEKHSIDNQTHNKLHELTDEKQLNTEINIQTNIQTNLINNNNEKLGTFNEIIYINYLEIKEILTNRYFLLATLGLCANNFALGGLAEWLATYLLRYENVSLDAAGKL